MNSKIYVFFGIILCMLFTNKICAQSIGLTGPTQPVASGTIFTFIATGETANKYVGSVPLYGSSITAGVTCPLYATDYYIDNNQAGKFQYRLLNTNTVAKTVEIQFLLQVMTKINGSLSSSSQTVKCTVTILPAPSGPLEISNLVTYPSLGQDLIGVKLPNENLVFVWDEAKLNSSTVNIRLYDVTNGYPGVLITTKNNITNNGSYGFSFSSLNLMISYSDIYKYRVVIENASGTEFGNSGIFCFVNEHPALFDFPNAFLHSYWIFRPDSSGSGYGELNVRWLRDRINASNVKIDLYNSDGSFNRTLVTSTPNDGTFVRPDDNTIPLGNSYFYQFKITSVENPSQFGFSEVFNHWLD
jgi:hypothetical protein